MVNAIIKRSGGGSTEGKFRVDRFRQRDDSGETAESRGITIDGGGRFGGFNDRANVFDPSVAHWNPGQSLFSWSEVNRNLALEPSVTGGWMSATAASGVAFALGSGGVTITSINGMLIRHEDPSPGVTNVEFNSLSGWAQSILVAADFTQLADRWKRETAHLSSITDIVTHDAYQRIIGMGQDVLPLILRELEKERRQWFWALRAITGENPVGPEIAGRIRPMAEAWLQWGRTKGLV